jgi:bifunctional non-homologous end joining protein LigD
MPLTRRPTPPEPPADPDDWRPQRFGRGSGGNPETLVEPGWDGVRVLARCANGSTRISDEDGVDCTDEFEQIAAAVTEAAQAGDLILDGYLTSQSTQSDLGIQMSTLEPPTPGQMLASMVVGGRVHRPTYSTRPFDPEGSMGFVAVDLLRIDGYSLLDVPLLERKRLLEGALKQSSLVRITPYVREPLGSFLSSWRSLGFQSLLYKKANSRYAPNARNDAWFARPMPMN